MLMIDTEKRYTIRLEKDVTATFNTPKPNPQVIEVLGEVMELARNYKPKEEPWHPGCPKKPSEGDCNCG